MGGGWSSSLTTTRCRPTTTIAFRTSSCATLLTGETTLLSRALGAAGIAANGHSATIPLGLAGRAIPPSISADGTKVVFTSVATNLVPGDANGAPDVFLRDLVANTTTRVSLDAAGQELPGFAVDGAISGDGLGVAFVTAQSLVAADTNAPQADVYVRTLATGAVELASRAGGASGLVGPNDSAISRRIRQSSSRSGLRRSSRARATPCRSTPRSTPAAPPLRS